MCCGARYSSEQTVLARWRNQLLHASRAQRAPTIYNPSYKARISHTCTRFYTYADTRGTGAQAQRPHFRRRNLITAIGSSGSLKSGSLMDTTKPPRLTLVRRLPSNGSDAPGSLRREKNAADTLQLQRLMCVPTK